MFPGYRHHCRRYSLSRDAQQQNEDRTREFADLTQFGSHFEVTLAIVDEDGTRRTLAVHSLLVAPDEEGRLTDRADVWIHHPDDRPRIWDHDTVAVGPREPIEIDMRLRGRLLPGPSGDAYIITEEKP